MKTCANCGHEEKNDELKFCPECGIEFSKEQVTSSKKSSKFCSFCGKQIEDNAIFCGFCGKKRDED